MDKREVCCTYRIVFHVSQMALTIVSFLHSMYSFTLPRTFVCNFIANIREFECVHFALHKNANIT